MPEKCRGDETCVPRALSGGWVHLGERGVWYEGCAGGKEVGELFSWGERISKKAKKQIGPVVQSVMYKGIEAAVDVYAGSLKKAVRSQYVQRRHRFDHDARGYGQLD